MAKRSSTSGVVRFKVARGAVARPMPVLVSVVGFTVLWLGGVVMLVASHVLSKGMVLVGPVGLVAMVLSLIVFMNLPGKVDIGSDGIFVDLRDKKRFVPFSDIVEASVYRENAMGKRFVGVALAMRSGEPMKLPIGEDQFGAGDRAAALSAALTEAIKAFQRNAAPDDAALLLRGDRSVAAWANDLRRIGEGANAGPRDAPIDPDRLLRIAESPAATAEARAGAAIALRAKLDAEGKKRLRIAAESTVSPDLADALSAAAEGDDEAVETALDRVRRD